QSDQTFEFIALTALCAVGFGTLFWLAAKSRLWRIPSELISAIVGGIPFLAGAALIILVPLDLVDYLPPVLGAPSIWEEPWTNIRAFVPMAALLGLISAGIAANLEIS